MNTAFEKLTGFPRETVLGRTARELLPGIQEGEFDWIGLYGKIALSGTEQTFEHYYELLSRWYRVFLHSGERFFFTAIFLDITESKRQMEGLSYSAVPPPSFDASGKRVLLVDDNQLDQRVALRLLANLGLSADVAENGEEALAAMEKSYYDLVLMDCLMPVMDGYEATRLIRSLDGNAGRVPIVATTSQILMGDREKCIEAGMDDYLAKPLSRVALAATLGRWLKEEASTSSFAAETLAVPRAAKGVPPERTFWQKGLLLKRLGDDRGFFRDIADAFHLEILSQLPALRVALEENRFDVAGKIAHFIKGGAANMNAVSLEVAAFDMQKALRNGCGGSVFPLLERLEYEFDRLDEVLMKELR